MKFITAKYSSKCASCGGAIAAGESILWGKGQPVRHAQCPAEPAPPSRKKPKPQGSRLPALVGESSDIGVTFEGAKSDRSAPHKIGDRRWVKIDGFRTAFVMVGWSPAKWCSAELLEDMDEFQYGGRGAYLGTEYYRFATPEEYEALQTEMPRLDGVHRSARVALIISSAMARLS